MSAIKDLRELINVSRLTYREDDSDKESDDMRADLASRRVAAAQPVIKSIKTDKSKVLSPIKSKTVPSEKQTTAASQSSRKSYVLSSYIDNPSSSLVVNCRDSLLDRKSIPFVQFNNVKNSLPPLNTSMKLDLDFDNDEDGHETLFNETIQPIRDPLSDQTKKSESSRASGGNFDRVLTYVDASVVSSWLNKASRYLKKLLKWHQSSSLPSSIFTSPDPSQLLDKPVKFESFVHFCQFWLGFNERAKLNDKQRRDLIKMEYSIIGDQIMQAFHAGLESQEVDVSEINQLMRAVFKEYPLQLLSFRGAYLLLDFVDILSSDRDEDYKKLLSDVKCRTVNKQCAQWLLSIRSYSLISLCWSVVKFYIKSVEKAKLFKKADTVKKEGTLEELDGRMSSLSMQHNENNTDNMSAYSSDSSSSYRSDSSQTNLNRKSTANSKSSVSSASSLNAKKKKTKTAENLDSAIIITPVAIKHEFYLQATFKYDYPEVLHYLITTKKCDPYQRDSSGRNLIFQAVMNERPKILSYLIRRVR